MATGAKPVDAGARRTAGAARDRPTAGSLSIRATAARCSSSTSTAEAPPGAGYPVDRTIFGPATVLASFGEQSRTTFKHASGRVSIILSPPDLFVAMEPERVFDTVMDDATKIGFDLRPLVTDYRVINEPNQFYALSPGQNALRPEQKTPVHGLTLAGGYTKQSWIDTMEGAVISGQRAARAVLA